MQGHKSTHAQVTNANSTESETSSPTAPTGPTAPTATNTPNPITPNAPTTPSTVVGACREINPTVNPANFARVLENFDRTTQLRLDGSAWDNTLIRNCHFHDVNGDAIFIRDVKNVVIQNCEFNNISADAIKTSSTGSSSDVLIIDNYIHDIGGNGIHSPQRILNNVNSDNLIIANNRLINTGLSATDGKNHGIYNQSRGAVISGNFVGGSRDGNGISFRSSGKISCNRVEGTSTSVKPGIRYFSDHTTGNPSVLLIEKNIVRGQPMGVHIYQPVENYEGSTNWDHVVKMFIIRGNDLDMNTVPIKVDDEILLNRLFTVTVD